MIYIKRRYKDAVCIAIELNYWLSVFKGARQQNLKCQCDTCSYVKFKYYISWRPQQGMSVRIYV